MNYLGIDFGRKRVGVSVLEGNVGIVLPLPAILSDNDEIKIEKISELIRKYSIDEIVVGYPISMNGVIGEKAREIDRFLKKLSIQIPEGLKIHRSDERLTSEDVTNQEKMFLQKQSAHKKRKHRLMGSNDSKSAVLILQDFMNEQNLLNS